MQEKINVSTIGGQSDKLREQYAKELTTYDKRELNKLLSKRLMAARTGDKDVVDFCNQKIKELLNGTDLI